MTFPRYGTSGAAGAASCGRRPSCGRRTRKACPVRGPCGGPRAVHSAGRPCRTRCTGRLLLRVDQLVSQEDGVLLEGLAALGALVGLSPGVDDLALEQQRLELEGLAAGTAIRPLPCSSHPAGAPPSLHRGRGRWSEVPAGPPASGSRGRLSDPPSGLPLCWGRFGLPLGRCPQTVPNNPNCLEDTVLREDPLTTASILESGRMNREWKNNLASIIHRRNSVI